MGSAKEKISKPPDTSIMAGSDSDVSWHTDPDNPMLDPDGQLRDAYERPQQFVYSPSEAGANFLHLSANAKDDLPSALRKDVNTARPKHTVKQVTHMNPVEVFEEEKLAAKHKAASTSKKKMSGTNKPIAQETLNAFSSFRMRMDCLKILPDPADDRNTSKGTSIVQESSASEAESIKEQRVSRKHRKHPRKDAAAKRARTGVRIPSVSNPSPEEGQDIPGDDDRDPPGANENAEEFQHQDAQIADMVQESQKAHHTHNLEMVFTDIIHEEGQKYRICWVCE